MPSKTLRPRTPDVLALLSVVAAGAGSAFFALVPTEGSVSGIGADGIAYSHTTHHTLLDTEGPSILIVLAVPVLLTLGALVIRHQRVRRGLAIVLCLGCVAGMMSVGLFYLPAAMLSIAAAAATPEPPSVVRRRAAMATSAVTSVLRLDADEQRRLLHRAAADGVSLQEAARAAVRAYVDG